MGSSGGSKKQKQAAADNGGCENKSLGPTAKCKKAKGQLKIIVRRADKTTVKVGAVTVKATASPTISRNSADKTGLADFGTVNPATYKIETALAGAMAKKFAPAAEKSVTVPAGTAVTDTVDVPPLIRLKIVLTDKADAKLSGVEWSMKEATPDTNTSGGDGLIDVEIPWTLESGELELTLKDEPDAFVPAPTPAPAAAPPAAGATPPYPVTISAADFLPAEEKATPSPRQLKFTVEIRDIEDGEGSDGAQARLHNLGFRWDGAAALSTAVVHYQRLYLGQKWKGSGQIADIMGDLKKRHDNG
jgi:hypothetical protein